MNHSHKSRKKHLKESMFARGGARPSFDAGKLEPAKSSQQQIEKGGISATSMTALLASVVNTWKEKTNLIVYGKAGVGKTQGIIAGTKSLAARIPVGRTETDFELQRGGRGERVRPYHFPRGGNRVWIDISDFDAEQIRQVKANNDVYFVFHTLKASKLDKYSFLGIPNPDLSRESGMIVELQKAWIDLMSDPNTVGTIFIDEINHGEMSVLQQLYSLFDSNRTIGDKKISDSVSLLGAGNPAIKGSGSQAMPDPLQARFGKTVELIVTPDEWFRWAETEGQIHPIVTAFVKTKPDKLFYFAPKEGKENLQVVPRSLEALSDTIWTIDAEWRSYLSDLDDGIPANDTTWVQNKRISTKTGEPFTFVEAVVDAVKSAAHYDWYLDFKFFVEATLAATWSDIVRDPVKFGVEGKSLDGEGSDAQITTRKAIVQLKVADQIIATGVQILKLDKTQMAAPVTKTATASIPEKYANVIPTEYHNELISALAKTGPQRMAAVSKILRNIKIADPQAQVPPPAVLIKDATAAAPAVADVTVNYPPNIASNLQSIAWVLYNYFKSGTSRDALADIFIRVVRSTTSGHSGHDILDAVIKGTTEVPWADATARQALDTSVRQFIKIINSAAAGMHNTESLENKLNTSVDALTSGKVSKPTAAGEEVDELPPEIPVKRDPQQSKQAALRTLERGKTVSQQFKSNTLPRPEVNWGTQSSLYPPNKKGVAADEGTIFKFGDETWQKFGPDDIDWEMI